MNGPGVLGSALEQLDAPSSTHGESVPDLCQVFHAELFIQVQEPPCGSCGGAGRPGSRTGEPGP